MALSITDTCGSSPCSPPRRRRAGSQVEGDLGAVPAGPEPARTLGAGHAHPYIHDLFQTVGRLPDGRDNAVVYADLLHIVPDSAALLFDG